MEAYDAECCAGEIRDGAEKIIAFVTSKANRMEAHQVERAVFSLVLRIGLAAMRFYFAERGTGDVGAAIIETGGRVLKRSKGLFVCAYFSIFGKIDVPRTRYRARTGESIFPLDRQANLPERCYSYFLQEVCNRLEVDRPYLESSSFLEEYFELQVAESVLIDLAKDAATDYRPYYENRALPDPEIEGEIQVASFDGKGVPVTKEEAAKLKARLGKGEKRQKKKEALVGVSYTVDRNDRTAEELAESLVDPEAARRRREEQDDESEERPRAKNVRRYASLERPKREVFEEIRDDAERRDPNHERPLAVLLDGAHTLRDLAIEYFSHWPVVVLILDIIHVTEYLWDIANALFGEKSAEGRQWVLCKLTEALKGRVGYVIGGLRQMLNKRKLSKSKRKTIQKAITYFENHREMMRYDEYLAVGMPVATSLVEATCGLVKQRMEGTGKRWGIAGAEAMLSLVSLKTSHDNDMIDFMKFRARRAKARLYGKRPRFRLAEDLNKAA
jgi:hypothetical protein